SVRALTRATTTIAANPPTHTDVARTRTPASAASTPSDMPASVSLAELAIAVGTRFHRIRPAARARPGRRLRPAPAGRPIPRGAGRSRGGRAGGRGPRA